MMIIISMFTCSDKLPYQNRNFVHKKVNPLKQILPQDGKKKIKVADNNNNNTQLVMRHMSVNAYSIYTREMNYRRGQEDCQ